MAIAPAKEKNQPPEAANENRMARPLVSLPA
jgi:hypothetical protein